VFEETKPEVVPYFNNLVAKFNASQSKVVVTHDFTSSLIAEFVRGNPPAIDCDNYNLTTSIFVARGVLADLSHLPQAKTIDPNIQALVTQYASFQDETSVLPYSVAAEGVIYNRDLFDKVGVSAVPTTWTEFVAVCEKFKSKGIVPIYQTYGDTWTTQQGLFDYTAGGMVDVAAFYRDLAHEATNLGPNSSVSFEKDFTAPCKQMLSLAPYSTRTRSPSTTPTATSPSPTARPACTCRGRGPSARSSRSVPSSSWAPSRCLPPTTRPRPGAGSTSTWPSGCRDRNRPHSARRPSSSSTTSCNRAS
jgi:raffinose/stachyose/melibiose transport system substrate-binding protein